ncbi:uncharacterized protein TNCV_171241 [Trichonephila clavipes]|nr:uncharacterized protein TNCV_171241 [Trichonephila clavipes]
MGDPHTRVHHDHSQPPIERNLRLNRPLRHLPLTLAHCRARLQWCLAGSGWNHAEWGRIVFSDESRFQLCPDDSQRRVQTHQGQRTYPAFTISLYTGLSTKSYGLGCYFF